jgi:deoxyribodipyrimidine photo-lyase
MMKTLLIYWFRHDLRVNDNLALNHACDLACDLDAELLPVFCHTGAYGCLRTSQTTWGFARMSPHRQAFLLDTLLDLRQQLSSYQLELLELDGELCEQTDFFAYVAKHYADVRIVCEDIVPPEEIAQRKGLQDLGLSVQAIWQSTMLNPEEFDFDLAEMPDQFTAFRHKVEAARYTVRAPAPTQLARLQALPSSTMQQFTLQFGAKRIGDKQALTHDQRSSFPYWESAFQGGSRSAMQHLVNYFSTDLAHRYKQTRNQLSGVDFSTKFSPWLASGALSAPQIIHALQNFEQAHGKSDSSYWIWFELLWRDYFRFLHLKYGAQLYRPSGLSKTPVELPAFDPARFHQWTYAATGDALIDAAMCELRMTGYVSNRLRQQVASYWLHELAGDWRVGAAWFESQLLDYDVYSNQGNWLYLAGLGTDPRGYLGGRWFDPQKQAKQHDADGRYRRLWNTL